MNDKNATATTIRDGVHHACKLAGRATCADVTGDGDMACRSRMSEGDGEGA